MESEKNSGLIRLPPLFPPFFEWIYIHQNIKTGPLQNSVKECDAFITLFGIFFKGGSWKTKLCSAHLMLTWYLRKDIERKSLRGGWRLLLGATPRGGRQSLPNSKYHTRSVRGGWQQGKIISLQGWSFMLEAYEISCI